MRYIIGTRPNENNFATSTRYSTLSLYLLSIMFLAATNDYVSKMSFCIRSRCIVVNMKL